MRRIHNEKDNSRIDLKQRSKHPNGNRALISE